MKKGLDIIPSIACFFRKNAADLRIHKIVITVAFIFSGQTFHGFGYISAICLNITGKIIVAVGGCVEGFSRIVIGSGLRKSEGKNPCLNRNFKKGVSVGNILRICNLKRDFSSVNTGGSICRSMKSQPDLLEFSFFKREWLNGFCIDNIFLMSPDWNMKFIGGADPEIFFFSVREGIA